MGGRYLKKIQTTILILILLLFPVDAYAKNSMYTEMQSIDVTVETVSGVLNLKCSTSYKNNKLVWSRNVNADGYQIYKSSSLNGKYKMVGDTREHFYKEMVQFNSICYYKVRAYYNKNGKKVNGKFTNPLKVTNRLSQTDVYAGDRMTETSVGVYIQPVKEADGYFIYRSLSKDSGFKKIANFKPKNRWCYLDEGLKKNAYYYYKVRAYKTLNGKKIVGPESSVICAEKWKESKLYELFPDGIPKTESQMRKYLTKIKVIMIDEKGKKSYKYLPVHKKLAKDVKEIFEEMAAANIPVRNKDTGSYNWRKMTTCNLNSHHSYGCVVDLNWTSNPFVKYGKDSYKAGYRPGKDPYSITQKTVEIWEKHGFTWGGDWKTYKDYMHMSYTGH